MRRNARKAALRALVPVTNAVIGVDLGDKKQAVVVTGGDGRVLARRSPRVGVHGLGRVLDWGLERAVAPGYRGVTVACEPTGSLWMVMAGLFGDLLIKRVVAVPGDRIPAEWEHPDVYQIAGQVVPS